VGASRPDLHLTLPGGTKVVSLLWAIVLIFLVLWLLGFTVLHLGTIVWLFLVIAVIALLYNLFTGSRSGRWY
jgi:Family of unknown function (DUF5670)